MRDDFYIGWNNDTPTGYKKTRKVFFLFTLIFLTLSGVVFTMYEQGGINSFYDYGEPWTVSGYLVQQPVWGLRTEQNGVIKTIPLVGFGKMGPESTISKLMASHQIQEGTMVTIRGKRFHYQGNFWMELTELENSLIKVGEQSNLQRDIKFLGYRELEGEIIDPKCFFGVMTPATKAIHRSCAIRCISGGIPPLLGIRENGKFVDYYFIVGSDMQPIHSKLLPYVGIPVKIEGKASSFDDWKLLEVDSDDLKIAFHQKIPADQSIAFCY